MSFQIQNAPVTKRIAAFILDLILLVIVATGGMLGVSAVTGFDRYVSALEQQYNDYAHMYDITSLDLSESEYNELSEEEKGRFQTAFDALSNDNAVLHTYSMISNLSLLIPSLGIFFAYAIMEFLVPLFLGNGQTVGKKVFSLGVIRIDGVKPSALMLFVRTLLGKYTVETMLPICFILLNGVFGVAGLTVIALIFLLNLGLLVFTEHRTVIHDAFAQTVVVDLQTQLVFDSPADLLAYKTRIAAEQAAQAKY